MEKIAIVGTGIAGMGCGHFLHSRYNLSFYEELDYIGGHTNTVTVEEEGHEVYIDTGFMVFNRQTYPNLTKLFEEIKAPVKKTDMSFSVQFRPEQLEYSGSSLNHLFAQRRNIFKPSFIRMLMQINRFNKESVAILDQPEFEDYSIGQYIEEAGFSQEMLWKYLIPMSSAVWSAPMEKILEFPAVSLIRFFKNHGFLGMNTQHQWYTLDHGSQAYRALLIAPFKDRIHTGKKIAVIERLENGKVKLLATDGTKAEFDKVILACHADQAYKLLRNRTSDEERLLSKFKYQLNKAVLHTDQNLMPEKKLAWGSWNYRMEEQGGDLVSSTIYWMNKLQQVSKKQNYFVSVNPPDTLNPATVLKEIDYEHPLFDVEAMSAQKELHLLNQHGPVYFCGSYFKYGFHEDAYSSALELCKSF